MLDLLNYYYYIITDRVSLKNNNYYFTYQNNYFCFYKYNGSLNEINELFNLNTYMLYNNYQINKIILNNKKEILTLYDNNYYCLVLLNINSLDYVNIKQVITFNQRNINLNILLRNNWYYLWSNKIDNIEYSINHLMHKYKLLYNSIYYYIGLTENSISYLKLLSVDNRNLSISHKRVNSNTSLVEFYNPLNLVIDYRIRDLAEYLKSCFFSLKMDILEIVNYFKKIKMSESDYLYFYVRMLFPSYYFDIYDNILSGKMDEKSILKITKLQDDYEYLLYEIYLVIKSRIDIIGIDWINSKFSI